MSALDKYASDAARGLEVIHEYPLAKQYGYEGAGRDWVVDLIADVLIASRVYFGLDPEDVSAAALRHYQGDKFDADAEAKFEEEERRAADEA